MRAMAVVVLDVGAERALELATTEDQYPVEALDRCALSRRAERPVGSKTLRLAATPRPTSRVGLDVSVLPIARC